VPINIPYTFNAQQGTYNNPQLNTFGGPHGLASNMSYVQLQNQIRDRRNQAALGRVQGPLSTSGAPTGRSQQIQGNRELANGQQPSLLDNVLNSMLGPGAATNLNNQNNSIYSQQQMADAAEAEASEHLTGANLPWLANQAARPGMSVRSPGIISRVLPAYAQALSGAAGARVNVPQQMNVANRQFQTQSESAGVQDTQDWMRIQQMLDAAQRGAAINNTGLISGLIGQILNGG
jgi:hypothetical protein